MRTAIVLGGYGLIGSALMRGLREAGFQVIGIGRSMASAMASDPGATWLIRDISMITTAEWPGLLDGVDVVVNASGALQDGGRDRLEAIHVTAIERLVEASATLPLRIVQISAAGANERAGTAFFRSKGRGDAIIQAGARDWVILRPVLVLAPDAYGGTALLRAAAAMPAVLPRVLPGAQVRTVDIRDVTGAVVMAARGEIPSGSVADLTESQSHAFDDLTLSIRRWMGFGRPVLRPALPDLLLRAASWLADGLGHLGWRSPLRSTALRGLRDGITGDSSAWRRITGRECGSLTQTLARMPAVRQDRLFARAYLLLPLAIATLSIFWLFSGLIALWDVPRAMAVLAGRLPGWLAWLLVVGGAIADIGVGLAILWRRWTKAAALAMMALSGSYLLGGALLAPALWGDPLGPMLKVFPGVMLAMTVWLLMEDR
ncbi:SDR family oxidoreductase [Paracoccus sp. M683]|uniref:SDR family oxidoreductase n=1 Tax=Paracoccus sp. M683 TaxID=2594268 RepID=UPI00117CB48D|nr:SDR family oxidoreductase [Paracoccus sp. M683]TRW98441.1 SDR family oxidoreductase [Paracoccus sp. M683]